MNPKFKHILHKKIHNNTSYFIKSCSVPHANLKMQIRGTMKYQDTVIMMAKIQKSNHSPARCW